MRDTERERQRHRQKEKQAPYMEPDVGLDPRTPGVTTWAEGRCSTTEPSKGLPSASVLTALPTQQLIDRRRTDRWREHS